MSPSVTVVVIDNAGLGDVHRLLHQLVRTSSPSVEIVLASMRAPHLTPTLARRVRRLKATSAEALDTAVAHEATRPHLTVVTTAAATFRAGWVEEVTARAHLYPDAISAIDASTGGVLLYPARVVSTQTPLAPWHSVVAVTARARVSQTGIAQTVSAVMIVKDEEDVLEECLSAVIPFVDEVVVYDTGSTDATMEIARSHGVKLVEGYWDDHFGNARNRALAHATGDWILQVDADEVASGSPDELRARLAVEAAEQLHVPIVSSTWQGVESGLETLPVRLFRRPGMEWVGALHEFPKKVDGTATSISPVAAPIRLLHSGYNLGKVMDRNKTARNVDLARRELDEAGPLAPNRAELLSNLVRSLMWANRTDEAMPLFDELRVTEGNPTAICMSGRPAVELMVHAGRIDEADRWLETLEATGEAPGNVAVLRARRHLATGEADVAAEAIRPFQEGKSGGIDPWSKPFDRVQLDVLAAEIDLTRGDAAAAAERFLRLVPRDSDALNLDLLLRTLVAAGRSFAELADLAPEELVARSVREASTFHPSGALAWFEALHLARPTDHRPVVAGNMFADRADWLTALTWSTRAGEMGLVDVCSLRGLAQRESAPLLDRCMSWMLLGEFFGADDAAVGLVSLVPLLDASERATFHSCAEQFGLIVTLPEREAMAPIVLGGTGQPARS